MMFLIKTLIAWRRFIVICGVVGAMVMTGIAFLLPRWYRATTTLLPPETSNAGAVPEELVRRLSVPLLGSFATSASSRTSSIEVLRSRTLAETIIAEFDLMEAYDVAVIEECLDEFHGRCNFALRDNGLLVIAFEDRSPERAARIANRMVELLDDALRGLKISREGRAREFIEREMLERRNMLAHAENALREFQERNRAVDVDDQLAAALELVTDLAARAITLEIAMRLAAHDGSPDSHESRRLKAEYDGVVEQLARLKRSGEVGVAGGFIPALADFPEVALHYGRLRRDVLVQTRVYTMLVSEHERVSMEAARDTPVIEVLDPAQPPVRHTRPRRTLLILAGTVFQLCWSATLALFVAAWRAERRSTLAAREVLRPITRDLARLRRGGRDRTTRVADSRGLLLALAGLSILPLLAWFGLRLTGLGSLLPLAVAAGCGALAAVVLLVRPRWGVYSLVFWVYSGVGSFAPVDAAPPILVLVLAMTLLGLVRGERNRMTDGVFWIATAFFVLFAVQSALVARNPALTFTELLTFAKVLAVVVVIVQLVRSPGAVRTLGYAAFAGAVATVVIGVVAIQTGIAGLSYIGGVDVLRFSGAHGDPNKAASIMCSALPFGVFAVQTERGLRRLLAVAAVVTLIVAIFATFSRGVFFSLAVLVIAFLIREIRSRRSFFVLSALIVVGALLTPSFYWNRTLGLTQALMHPSADWSVYTRLLAFKTGVEMFLQHPLTGIGLGNFIESASYRLFVRVVTHNTYLDIAVGAGIFGLAAFLAMLGAGLRHAWRGARAAWPARLEWMNLFSFCAFLSLLSIATSGLFLTFAFRYQLWIPVAVGLAIGRFRAAGRAPADA